MSRGVTFNQNVRRTTFEYPEHSWSNNTNSNGTVIEGYGQGDPYKQTSSEYDANAKYARENMTEDRKASLRAAAIQRQDFLQSQACKHGQYCPWQGGKVAKKTKRKRSRRTKKSRRHRKK